MRVPRLRLLAAMAVIVAIAGCTSSFARRISRASVMAEDGRISIVPGSAELFQVYRFSHNPVIPFAYGGYSFVWEAPLDLIRPNGTLELPNDRVSASLYTLSHGARREPRAVAGTIQIEKVTPEHVIANLHVWNHAANWEYKDRVRYRQASLPKSFHE